MFQLNLRKGFFKFNLFFIILLIVALIENFYLSESSIFYFKKLLFRLQTILILNNNFKNKYKFFTAKPKCNS